MQEDERADDLEYLSEKDIKDLVDSEAIHPVHEGCKFVLDVLRGKGVNPSISKMRERFAKRRERKPEEDQDKSNQST